MPEGRSSLFVLAASIAALLVSAGATARAQSWIGGDPASPTVWSDNNNWTNPPTFPNGAGTTAIFDNSVAGFSNATPFISGTDPTAAITVGTITFNTTTTTAFTITVTGTSGAPASLTISGGGVTNNSAITQDFVITGDGTAPTSGGTASASVVLNNSASAGNNTSWTLNSGGAAYLSGSASAGTNTTWAVSTGSAIYFSGTSNGTTTSSFANSGTFDISQQTGGVTVGAISGAGTFSLGGNTLNTNVPASFTLTNPSSVGGVIQDGGAGGGTGGILTVNGPGALALTGTTNSYTGGTLLTGGALLLNDTPAAGSPSGAIGSGPLTITNPGGTGNPTVIGTTTAVSPVPAGSPVGTTGINGDVANGQIVKNALNIGGNFSVYNPNGDIYFAGATTLLSTQTVTGLTALGQVHFQGGIAGATSSTGINFVGGTSQYTAFIYDGSTPNTYTGLTTVGNNAFLVLGQSVSNEAVVGNVLITQGGSLDLINGGAANQTAPNITVTDNSTGLATTSALFAGFEMQNNTDTIATLLGDGTVGLGSGTLTVSNGNFTGNIADGNSGFTGGNLVVNGPGTLTLSGTCTYTGTTTVNGGTLQAGSSTGFSPNSAFTVNSSGTLDVNGFNPTVGSLAGSGVVTNSSTTPGTLITGFNSTSTSFTGSLQNGAGPLALVKVGFGTFTVSNSTYSGATDVLEGSLQAGATTAFSPRSAYVISAPGFLDINGFNSSIGSLAGNGTVTNFGSTAATLTTGLDDTNTTFSGTIQDSTTATIALVKTGAGTMTLASENTFSGGTTLENGTIVVASILALGSGNMTVNGGTLKASGSPVDIQVGGNYTQTGGQLDLRIGGATGGAFDQLAVVGHASLAGRLNISSFNGYVPTRGTDITIVTAGGGVSGRFQQVTGSLTTLPEINFSLEYQPNDVVLQFNGTTFEDIVGLTPNQKAVAAALDNAAINAKSNKVVDYLDALPARSIPAALDRIAPEEYASIYQISISSAKLQATSIENRLDAIHGVRTAAGGPTGAPDANNPSAVNPATSLGSVFANASGEFVSVGDSSNAAGYNFSSGGVTIGADYRFNDNFVAGVLLNYTRTRADLVNNGRLDADGIRGGVYASYFGSGAYVNAYLGAGYNDYNMQRTGLDSTVRGNTNGGEFNGLVQGGYDAHIGPYTFGPVASVQYTYTGLSSLVEQGSIDPLNIDSYREQSVRTNVGVRATYEWHIGHYILTPEIRATYQHEFADVVDSVTAGMLFGGPRFTVAGPQIGRDSILLNVGFTLTIAPQMSGYLFYDGELGRSNYQDNNLLLGFRYDF